MVENKYDEWNMDGDLPEINTCPFCGGDGILCDNGYEEPVIDSNGAYVDIDHYEGDAFWCMCKECEAMSDSKEDPEEAIEAWNKRV